MKNKFTVIDNDLEYTIMRENKNTHELEYYLCAKSWTRTSEEPIWSKSFYECEKASLDAMNRIFNRISFDKDYIYSIIEIKTVVSYRKYKS